MVEPDPAASTRYQLSKRTPVRRSALAWTASVLEGVLLGTSTGSVSFDASVMDMISGRTVYGVRTTALSVVSAVASIRDDLETLTIHEFQHSYQIAGP